MSKSANQNMAFFLKYNSRLGSTQVAQCQGIIKIVSESALCHFLYAALPAQKDFKAKERDALVGVPQQLGSGFNPLPNLVYNLCLLQHLTKACQKANLTTLFQSRRLTSSHSMTFCSCSPLRIL